ncbi:hypothetical protein CPAR01_06415 [Colletotrichum paranaense]|uniref:Uncharacterized protein n=1 Tax=Colletotrichum paranaense TaxID=1914294 RepID=A0ABQ9SMZ2_9PEZI|nr:uncharacterized protein CPAR01_06415 [Colletotrichum paranaense]KAK1540426.1 hypothetical protein CPAR01_06415 [Colletotrichum paranaense]
MELLLPPLPKVSSLRLSSAQSQVSGWSIVGHEATFPPFATAHGFAAKQMWCAGAGAGAGAGAADGAAARRK